MTVVEVAAAILLRDGEFLLAQRPQGKVYAGYWEFPGGKVEPGESMRAALQRELHEELGIVIDEAWPWLSREFSYPHAEVRLKFFKVTCWHGAIAPSEHSGLVWVKIGAAPPVAPVLPANGPILRALELPAVYVLTNAAEIGIADELTRLESALAGGLRLIQLRDKTLPPFERRRFAAAVMNLARPYRACVLVNDDENLAREIGAQGVHLSYARLMQLERRPPFAWVAASCHTAGELERAAALALDFVLLGPVLPTPSHPQNPGMGWEEFARRVERSPLPVFALGGMRPALLATAWENGAHGIAMLRGWGDQKTGDGGQRTA
jgi:8-oxo-dGTP diphosphatase